MNASPKNPKIPLKNPAVAAILAFLVPGAGHFYQGRLFKGVIYFVCILTLFVWGMQIGDWNIMYRLQPDDSHHQLLHHRSEFRNEEEYQKFKQQLEMQAPSRENVSTHWGYYAQLPIGLFSIPSFIQEKRYYSDRNVPTLVESLNIDDPIGARLDFLNDEGKADSIRLSGLLELAPEQGDFGQELNGIFRGRTEDGKDVEVELGGQAILEAPIGSSPDRRLQVGAYSLNDNELRNGMLVAETDRAFSNSFLVPPDYPHLKDLHLELGKKYTLAEVFTWIAGLLNVLAIWDAFAGPAYGYRLPLRMEEDAEDKKKKSNKDEGDEKELTPLPSSSETA